jgi:hypothetical protein
MRKIYELPSLAHGYITHADQETDGLSFRVLGNVVLVIGDTESVIEAWATRNSGEELTLLEARNKLEAILEAAKTAEESRLTTFLDEVRNRTLTILD